ncbi:MAG: hypothetical protein H7301_06890 [Cryobacterium sp.]|nr:hypothetical protein [Oligoflexia bacterium]
MRIFRSPSTLILLCLFSLFPFRKSVAAQLSIVNQTSEKKDFTFLLAKSKEATRAFESAFGNVNAEVTIEYGGKDCLRTGYDFRKQTVHFCPANNVVDSGTASADVIHHELFHALLCSKNPELCTPEILKSLDVTAVHEGLADHFAYTLTPDENFGEGYLKDALFLRKYLSPGCYTLQAGAHDRGSALTSQLVKNQTPLSEIAELAADPNRIFHVMNLVRLGTGHAKLESEFSCFLAGDSAPQINTDVKNYPNSRLNRYTLLASLPLELRFVPNEAMKSLYPDFSVEWAERSPEKLKTLNLTHSTLSPMTFLIRFIFPESEKFAEKIIVKFLSAGEVIGSRAFYFVGRADDPSTAPPFGK